MIVNISDDTSSGTSDAADKADTSSDPESDTSDTSSATSSHAWAHRPWLNLKKQIEALHGHSPQAHKGRDPSVRCAAC